MHDLAVELAGLIAIAVAIVHGILGETAVFAKSKIEPAWARTLLRLIWLSSAIAWAAGGVLLVATPSFHSPTARIWIIAIFTLVYSTAAACNAWATHGRHIGWKLLSAVVVLALAGL
jgi:hypothetical protein